jgi:hypothetical protein
VLEVAVPLGRDLGHGAAVAQAPPDRVAAVALAPPCRRCLRPGEHDGGIADARLHRCFAVRAMPSGRPSVSGLLPGGHAQGRGQTLRVGADVELAREANARAVKTLPMSPPLPPAAQWCARMLVLWPVADLRSPIICRRSASPPPSARASSITAHRPEPVHRRNGRNTEFQLPGPAGRSRHGAPVRAIQKMASGTRRWSRAGLPPSGLADTTKGSKKHHSSSVSRPRINADLHARDQLGITYGLGWESPRRQFGLAAWSNASSPRRNTTWGWRCSRSASPTPPRGSRWPTSPKICAAWPGLRQEPDPPECSDRLQRPASHSGPKRT